MDSLDRGWYLRRACVYGILTLQLFAVLAFGAVEYWSRGTLQLGACLFLALWVASFLLGGALRLRRNPLYFPMLGFGLLVTLQYLAGGTAYLPVTRQGLLLLAAYFWIFLVLVNTVETHEQKMMLVTVLIVFGSALAIFAMAQDFFGNGRLYWWRETVHAKGMYGPYIDHAHYAGLMNMLALMPLGLVLGRTVRGDKVFIMLFLTLLMFVSLIFSGARGGMISFVGQLVLLGLIFLSRRQGRQLLAVLVVAVLLTVLASAVGMVILEKRFETGGLALARQGRVTVWMDTITGIRDHFWMGTGFGTFEVVYPQYRTRPSDLLWNAAHNDYLQLFLETGIFGFLLMAWFLVRLAVFAAPRLLQDQGPDFGVALGATLGIFGMLIHSLSDFNMQIPANAMMFYVLCALLTL